MVAFAAPTEALLSKVVAMAVLAEEVEKGDDVVTAFVVAVVVVAALVVGLALLVPVVVLAPPDKSHSRTTPSLPPE